MHAGAEHFYRGDDACGCDAGDGASKKRGVGGGYVGIDGAVGGGTQSIIAGEVDYICGNGHDKGGREAAPEGCGTFIASDFTEAVEGGGECFLSGLVDGAIGCWRGGDGWVQGCDRSGRGGSGGYTEGRGVVHPEDFAAAGCYANVLGEVGEGRGRLGICG